MALVHPVVSIMIILIVICSFFIGGRHYLDSRRGISSRFNRSLHVRLGSIGVILLVLSAAGGLVMAGLLDINMNMQHFAGGIIVAALAAMVGVWGRKLLSPVKDRKQVKAVHRVLAVLLMIGIINQVASGYKVFFM